MLLEDALARAEAALVRQPGKLTSTRALNAESPEQASYVFRADMSEAGSLIAKVAAPGRLGDQFARLTVVHPHLQSGLYRVPKPIGYDTATGVLLMEDAWGMAAETLWINGGGRPRALIAAGGWLARYHGLTASRAAFNPDPHLNWLRKTIAAHDNGSRVIPDAADLAAHLPEIEQLAAESRNATSIRCITHRDFHLRNLLIRKHGRAYGIDMENAARDEAMRDLLFLLADTARATPEAPTTGALQETAAQLCLGYGRRLGDPPARLFFQRCFALNLWAAQDIKTQMLSASQARRLQTAQALLASGDLLAASSQADGPQVI